MPLKPREVAESFDLPDRELVIAGDWHANWAWIGRAIPAAARTGAATVLHLGDFGFWPSESEDLLRIIDDWVASTHANPSRPGIDRVLITPGNHEDWTDLDAIFAEAPGQAVRVSDHVWVMPRGFRFTIGGRTFMSFGGAASVDFASRQPGRTWWASEIPTMTETEAAATSGSVDVLLTHDAGALFGPRVTKMLTRRAREWSPTARAYATYSRQLIEAVVAGVKPALHLHGHYHVRESTTFALDDHSLVRVECLAMDNQLGNLALLDLTAPSVTDIDVHRRSTSPLQRWAPDEWQ